MSCMPPWVPHFESCLHSISAPPVMTFCTVSKEGMPRARTVVFRSWLFNDKSTGVLLFSTDKRMDKVEDLENNNGRFEACIYFPNEQTQFRFSGFSQLLGPGREQPSLLSPISQSRPLDSPSRSSNSSSPSSETHSGSFYPVFTPSYDSANTYDTEFPPPSKDEWMAEYERMWGTTPKHIKQGFKNPPPGRLLTKEYQKHLDAISRGVDGSSDESGKDNFVVVLMFINSVDQLELTHPKRTLFTRTKHDEWIEQDTCP